MKQILQEQNLFYERLYTSKISKTETYQQMVQHFLIDNQMPILTDIDKNLCDITIIRHLL